QSRASRLGATAKRVETSPGAPTSLVRCRHAGKLEYAQGPCRHHALRRDRSGGASHRAIADGLMNLSECGRSLRSKRRRSSIKAAKNRRAANEVQFRSTGRQELVG